jgi:PAS domain S-box-containing protein
MEGAIRVLHVDDDPHFRELTVECLEAEGLFLVEPAPAPAEAREKLDERFDCIVSDYEMPDRDGIEFLESVRAEHPDLPFILFTGEGSESIASEAISAGVTDYLQKSGGTEQFTLLANRIRNAVEAARSKRQLGERTRRLETLIDNLPGMVYRCRNEPTWPMENVEGEGEELTGYTADALECGEVVWGEAVLHPDEREEIWTEVQEQLDQTGSFETTYRIRTKHGETKWAWERGRLVDGQVLEGFITDITDRRNRQKELEQYEALIDTVQDGIMVANREFEIETVNRAGAAAMGASPSDIEGENGVDLAAEYSSSEGNPEKLKSAFETTVERDPGADPVTTELEFDLPIGHEFVEYQLTPFRASGEEKIAVIGRNVTDREERERELRRKNERLEKFASVVSHDLRNPLQIASTRLDLAQADCDSEHLGDIERALDRMGQLIDDILTLAREGEKVSETEHVELARASRRSWQQVRAPSSSLDVETERSLDADPNRLDQLLTNLFENAVEHGPANEPREPGSQTAEDESAVTVRVGELTDGFYVADDGTGIPAEDREQIFDEGYSTSAEGTGFGLSIVEEIATAHGWEVDVTESESGGARFEITGIESSGA